MYKVLLTTFVGVVLSSSAFAASETEYWYQPEAGKSALNIGLDYSSVTAKATIGALNGEIKTTSTPLKLKYAYGLDTGMSISAETSFGTDETKTSGNIPTSGNTTKDSGLSDLKAEFLAKADSWYFGAGASVALAKKKSGTTTSDGNRSSGGYSLTPFVGYKSSLGLGGKVSYQYAMDKTEETATTDKTISGGSVMSLEGFWETSYGPGVFGALVNYAQTDETTTKQSGQPDDKGKGFGKFGVGAFVSYDVSANGTILGNVGYVNVPEYDFATGVKVSSSGTTLSAAYRMNF